MEYIGYKFRIYPTNDQKILIDRILGSYRFIYNFFLSYNEEIYKDTKKHLSKFQMSKLLTQLKQDYDFKWLYEMDSIALQEAIKDLDSAYQYYFKYGAGFPKFKSKKNHHQSYRTRNQNKGKDIRIVKNKIHLPKIGFVKFKQTRECPGRILNATISKTPTNQYYISLCLEINIDLLKKDNNSLNQIGIDIGIKNFYTDSNGQIVNNPRFLECSLTKIKRAKKNLDRKKYHSKNWEKSRLKLVNLYQKVTNQRRDFLHKESLKIVKNNKFIAIESINIKGLLKNHKIAFRVFDVSWYEFLKFLEYKSYYYDSKVIKIDTFYPSSQLCSECGYRNKDIKNLNIREWQCPQCGTVHDRDINAAKNILKEGLRLFKLEQENNLKSA